MSSVLWAPKDTKDLIDSLNRFFESLVNILGVPGTIVFGLVVVGLIIGWKLYKDRRKGKETHLALAEKDRTIIRLSKENLHWKILFFQDKGGWSDQKINDYLLDPDFAKIAHGFNRSEQTSSDMESATKTTKGDGAKKATVQHVTKSECNPEDHPPTNGGGQ